MDLEYLKTVRLLLMQLANDTDRTIRMLPDGSRERNALIISYNQIQKSMLYVEIQIRGLNSL